MGGLGKGIRAGKRAGKRHKSCQAGWAKVWESLGGWGLVCCFTSNPVHPRHRRKVAARVEASRGWNTNLPPKRMFQPQRSFPLSYPKEGPGAWPLVVLRGDRESRGPKGGKSKSPLGPLAQRSAFPVVLKTTNTPPANGGPHARPNGPHPIHPVGGVSVKNPFSHPPPPNPQPQLPRSIPLHHHPPGPRPEPKGHGALGCDAAHAAAAACLAGHHFPRVKGRGDA